MLDVMVAVFVLSIGSMGVFSLIPVAHRSQALASEEAKASHMTTRVLEQLQQLKVSELNPSLLTQLGLIDAGQSQYPANGPFSFAQVPLDDATGMSPAKALRGAVATFALTPIQANSVRIDLTLRWTSATGKARLLKTGTVVGGYK